VSNPGLVWQQSSAANIAVVKIHENNITGLLPGRKRLAATVADDG